MDVDVIVSSDAELAIIVHQIEDLRERTREQQRQFTEANADLRRLGGKPHPTPDFERQFARLDEIERMLRDGLRELHDAELRGGSLDPGADTGGPDMVLSGSRPGGSEGAEGDGAPPDADVDS